MPDHKKAAEPLAPEPAVAPAADPVPRTPQQTCREVERVLGREPLDRVRCAHLFGDYYRCNWWSRSGVAGPRSGYDWAGLLTDHVRASRVLRVTATFGRPRVEEVAEPARVRGPH